jgi:hypothetical protein
MNSALNQQVGDFLVLKIWKFCHYSGTSRKSDDMKNEIELGDFQEVIDFLGGKIRKVMGPWMDGNSSYAHYLNHCLSVGQF